MMSTVVQQDGGREPPRDAAAGVVVGVLEIDPAGYRGWLRRKKLALTVAQLELLMFLIANRGRVVSRTELAHALGLRGGRSVDVLLTRTRKQLGCEFVRNVRSRGWILDPEALES